MEKVTKVLVINGSYRDDGFTNQVGKKPGNILTAMRMIGGIPRYSCQWYLLVFVPAKLSAVMFKKEMTHEHG